MVFHSHLLYMNHMLQRTQPPSSSIVSGIWFVVCRSKETKPSVSVKSLNRNFNKGSISVGVFVAFKIQKSAFILSRIIVYRSLESRYFNEKKSMLVDLLKIVIDFIFIYSKFKQHIFVAKILINLFESF